MITLALIGTGRWGTHYIQTAAKLKNCQIKYVCSPHIKHKSISAKYVQFRDYREIYVFNDIDGIIIATPPQTHFKIASDLILRKYNLLIEKPFVTNLKDGLIIKKLYNHSNLVINIGYIYLYNTAYMKLKELVPALGSIYYISSIGGDWKESNGTLSALWEWTTHDVSMIINLFNKSPIAVSALSVKGSKNQELISIRLQFKNNLNIFIKSGSLLPEKKRKLTVVGSRGSIIFDDLMRKKLTHYDYSRNSTFYPKYKKNKPLELELTAFVDAIKNKRQSDAVDQAISITKILHYAEKSIYNNGKLTKVV